ncbi:MAG TPA: hypothetical protein VK074_11075, partial [Fodinibius sp.]|nr:hypothetical protein [Fodinibius sp.]
GCDIDTLFTALEHEFTDRSGKYRIVYHIGGMEEESCFQASIKLSDKELISKTFQVDFRLNSPFDSVRIDFVLQDLKKRKE